MSPENLRPTRGETPVIDLETEVADVSTTGREALMRETEEEIMKCQGHLVTTVVIVDTGMKKEALGITPAEGMHKLIIANKKFLNHNIKWH